MGFLTKFVSPATPPVILMMRVPAMTTLELVVSTTTVGSIKTKLSTIMPQDLEKMSMMSAGAPSPTVARLASPAASPATPPKAPARARSKSPGRFPAVPDPATVRAPKFARYLLDQGHDVRGYPRYVQLRRPRQLVGRLRERHQSRLEILDRLCLVGARLRPFLNQPGIVHFAHVQAGGDAGRVIGKRGLAVYEGGGRTCRSACQLVYFECCECNGSLNSNELDKFRYKVTHREKLLPEGAREETEHGLEVLYVKRKANSRQSAAIDPNHTHFVMVDNGKDEFGGEIQLRGSIEHALSQRLRHAANHHEIQDLLLALVGQPISCGLQLCFALLGVALPFLYFALICFSLCCIALI